MPPQSFPFPPLTGVDDLHKAVVLSGDISQTRLGQMSPVIGEKAH
jgi:hypothetical protein